MTMHFADDTTWKLSIAKFWLLPPLARSLFLCIYMLFGAVCLQEGGNGGVLPGPIYLYLPNLCVLQLTAVSKLIAGTAVTALDVNMRGSMIRGNCSLPKLTP